MAERITGHTELIGLMAYPIRHSSSPAMHNEAFAYLGLDYAYLAFEVDNNTLEDAVKGGLLDETLLDEAVKRVLTLMYQCQTRQL